MQLLKINKYKKIQKQKDSKMIKLIEVINTVKLNAIPSPMEIDHINSLVTMALAF